jgi:hypothetical protein
MLSSSICYLFSCSKDNHRNTLFGPLQVRVYTAEAVWAGELDTQRALKAAHDAEAASLRASIDKVRGIQN